MDAMMRVGALARVSEMHVLTPVWERSDSELTTRHTVA